MTTTFAALRRFQATMLAQLARVLGSGPVPASVSTGTGKTVLADEDHHAHDRWADDGGPVCD